jgi:hypothetical protein
MATLFAPFFLPTACSENYVPCLNFQKVRNFALKILAFCSHSLPPLVSFDFLLTPFPYSKVIPFPRFLIVILPQSTFLSPSICYISLQRTVDSSRQIYALFSPQQYTTVHLSRTVYVFMCPVFWHKSNYISLHDTNWRLQSSETAPRRPQISGFPASLAVSRVCYSAAKSRFLNRWSIEDLLL